MKVRTCVLKLLGINMSIVAPATIGLGIADLVLTYNAANCSSGCMLVTPLALTWVAVALWAPIPVFVNGLTAFKIAGHDECDRGWICLLSFMTAFVFTPAIVIISGLEAYYKFPNGVPSAATDPMYQTTAAIFGIDVTIAVIGFVLHLHAVGVLYLVCCCRQCMNQHMAAREPKPQKLQPQEECQECAVNRMNIWSAYRMGEGSPAQPQQPQQAGVWRTHYAVGGGLQPQPVVNVSAPAPRRACPCSAAAPASCPFKQQVPTQVTTAGNAYVSRPW